MGIGLNWIEAEDERKLPIIDGRHEARRWKRRKQKQEAEEKEEEEYDEEEEFEE